MISLSTAKFFFRVYNPNISSCWLNDKEWFLNSAFNFCRKIYNVHLLLDNLLNRSRYSVVLYVTEGFLTVRARAASWVSFQPFLWAPPTILTIYPQNLRRVKGRRGGFAPPVGQVFPLPEPSFAVSPPDNLLLILYFSAKMLPLKPPASPVPIAPSLVPSQLIVHTSIIAIITQCGNDLLKLWALHFVFPIL